MRDSPQELNPAQDLVTRRFATSQGMASSVIREKTPSPRRWRAIRTVVTWNGVGFDFDVLAAEAQMLAECRALALAYVDIMFNVVCRLGYGVAESTPA